MLLFDIRFWLSVVVVIGGLGLLFFLMEKLARWGEKKEDDSLPRLSVQSSVSSLVADFVGIVGMYFVMFFLTRTVFVLVILVAVIVIFVMSKRSHYIHYPRKDDEILLDIGPVARTNWGVILFYSALFGLFLLGLVFGNGTLALYLLYFLLCVFSFVLVAFYFWSSRTHMRFSEKGLFVQEHFIRWQTVKKANWQEKTPTHLILALNTFTRLHRENTYYLTVPRAFQETLTFLLEKYLGSKFDPDALPTDSTKTNPLLHLGFALCVGFLLSGISVAEENFITTDACRFTWSFADVGCAFITDIGGSLYFSEIEYLSDDSILLKKGEAVLIVPLNRPSLTWLNANKLSHPSIVDAIALAPDRKSLAVCFEEDHDPEIWIWDLESRALIQQIPLWEERFCPGILGDEFSFRPPLVIYSGTNGISVIHVKAGGEQASFDGGGEFSVGSHLLAFVTPDDTVQLVDLNTYQPLREIHLDITTENSLPRLALSSDDSLLAVLFLNGKLLLMDTATGETIKTLQTFDPEFVAMLPPLEPESLEVGVACYHVVFSPDGKTLATCVEIEEPTQNYAILWDVETGQKLEPIQLKDRVDHLAFSPTGSKILVSSDEGQILFFDLEK